MENFQHIAGGLTAIGGVVTTILGAGQQFKAIEQMTRAAEAEMKALQLQGAEQALTAIQNAFAAVENAGFLRETTQHNIAFIDRQSDAAIGSVIAASAGAGLDFVGAPVLKAANVALEASRMIQNQRLTERVGVRQFEFQADQYVKQAQLARQGADIAIEATRDTRSAAIGAATFDAFKSLISAGNQVTTGLIKAQTILKKE